MTKRCALCDEPVGKIKIIEPVDNQKDLFFCCHGCQAVFQVLSVQNAKNKESHPLFIEAVRSGLISNPALLEQIEKQQQKEAKEKSRLYLEIHDLWCPSCADVIQLTLRVCPGVLSVVVDYATDQACITYDPTAIGAESIREKIRSLGYTPASIGDPRGKKVSGWLWLRFAVAIFSAMNAMMFAYPIYASYFWPESGANPEFFARLSLGFALPAVCFSAWPIYHRFWSAFRVGVYGMEALVVLSVSAAFIASLFELMRGGSDVYFDSLTVIIALVLVGRIIESKAKFSAKDALVRLDRALPKRGRIKDQEGKERFVPLKEITAEMLVVVLTGERLPVDGIVHQGEGLVDESQLTGEAIAQQKKQLSSVFSGSILRQGRLLVKVTKTSEKSSLQYMMQTVESDLQKQKTCQKAVDQVARWFVPVVVILALFTMSVHLLQGMEGVEAVMKGLAVLLIACPCAVGVAAPLVESELLNTMAKMGVIVRNRAVLSTLAKVKQWCFDKTGTVTEGNFSVQEGIKEIPLDKKRLLGAVVRCSHHPISAAIADEIQCELVVVDQVTEVAGQGIHAEVEGHRVALGSAYFLRSLGIRVDPLPALGSCTFFAVDGKFVSQIVLEDAIKEGVEDAVGQLSESVLLSGDREQAVSFVAKHVGFSKFFYEKTPLQKRECIQRIQGNQGCVAMVGDGINDAAALALADVGISVYRASDVSVQVSDILLTSENIAVLPAIYRLAKKGQKILWQNLGWSFSYNIVGVCLAIAGRLSPLYAAVAMVCSSLLVLANAKRVRL